MSLLLGACAGPGPAPITPTASPAPTAILHAPEIRFALVGRPTAVNVWALFDETGASYPTYAIHSEEFPSLYRLSIPEREFEPHTAEGMPSAVTQEGDFYVASVRLQPGLNWSNGSPLTAADVAFTVNTALAFDLSLDWRSAYNPGKLDRAEALEDGTIKYYFKSPFNVGDWQYGALQGPIVNEAYWSPKITEAAALLPAAELAAELESVRAGADMLQARIDADNAQLLTTLVGSETYNELTARVERNQNELNSLNSQLVDLQDEYEAASGAARAALFALPDDAEPTFGPFLRATQSGGVFTREVNTNYPFKQPNFDLAVYTSFDNINSAYEAFKEEVTGALISPYGGAQVPDANYYPSSSSYFLVFNPNHALLAVPTLRRSIACIMGIYAPMESPNESLVLPGPWQDQQALSPCSELSRQEKIEAAVELLKTAGYSWSVEPTDEQPGSGLRLSDGETFPAVRLLTILPEFDRLRANATIPIQQHLQYLGLPVEVEEVAPEALRYDVFSTGDYDMAILGYRLSQYPGYLCDWFGDSSPFGYSSARLGSACAAFNGTADLETAQQASLEVQSILIEDLPFIPVYQLLRYETYQGVAYPFESILDGISGLYGAPGLAMPAP